MGHKCAITRGPEERDLPARGVWLAEHYPALGGLLEQVEEKIAGLACARGELLNNAGQYVISGRAKRLRPALLLLSAEACGGPGSLALEAAAVVELVHTASLVHDDVLDESSWRRGRASARALWGNKISVLLGDYLLCRAVSHLEAVGSDSMVEKLLSVTQQMCHGQVAEITEAGPNLTESRYLEIVTDKTASLLGFCGWLGARSVSAPLEAMEILERFARNFGMAFQIADDVHDLVGSQEASGKPVNHDLRQKKTTLPVIFSLTQLKGAEHEFLRRALSEPALSRESLSRMRQLAAESGGIAYAWSVCRQYLEQAHQALDSLPQALPSLQPQSGCLNPESERAYQALLLTCGEAFPLPVMA